MKKKIPGLPALSLPRFSKAWRLLAYVFAVLQPGPAFALGLLYAAQDDGDAKRFGKACLAFSLLGFAIRVATAFDAKGMDSGESFVQPYH